MQQQEQHSVPNMVDDWSQLERAIQYIREDLNSLSDYEKAHGQLILMNPEVLDVVVEYVPRLMDRYNELLELSHVMTSAWEKLNASKNDLYVPDAAEMVQSAGLKDRP